MKTLARRIVDGAMLHLIKMWLETPVEEIDDRGKKHRTTRNRDEGRGTPQGAPVSPLLSNLYMRRFVLGWKTLGHEQRWQAYIVNYADDRACWELKGKFRFTPPALCGAKRQVLTERRIAMSSTGAQASFPYDEQELLRKIPCPLIPTNLKGAYAIPAPPDDFDPDAASEAELFKHGLFWPRPDETTHPALARLWQRLFSRGRLAKDYVVPVLEPQVGKTHILREPLKQVANLNYVGEGWAGAGIRFLGPWNALSGAWQIPTVSQPSEPAGPDGIWNSSSWIGIDGFNPNLPGSTDVLQVGIEQEVDANGNPSYVAWFEWFAPPQQGSPAYIYQTNFANFPVAPGQQMLGLVFFFNFLPFFPPFGIPILINETTGQHTSIFLVAPPGASAAGDTVEWVMEAPFNGSKGGFFESLPKFTPVVFSSAVASGALGVDAGNPQFGDTFNIETAGNQLLTSVTLENETVTINFIG